MQVKKTDKFKEISIKYKQLKEDYNFLNMQYKELLTLNGVVKPFYCQSKNVAEINYNDLDFEKCKKQCEWCKAI